MPEGRRPESMVECPRGAKTGEPKLEKGKEIFILGIEYLTKSAFSWIQFNMDVFKNLVKRTFCCTRRYFDGKEKSKKTNDKT